MNLELKNIPSKISVSTGNAEPYRLGGVMEITDNTEYGDGYFAITIFDRRVLLMDYFEYVKDADTGYEYVRNGEWVAKSDKPN